MNNQELAQVFDNIGDLLEIKGEIVYKVLAYRRAAESLRGYGQGAGRHRVAGAPRYGPLATGASLAVGAGDRGLLARPARRGAGRGGRQLAPHEVYHWRPRFPGGG